MAVPHIDDGVKVTAADWWNPLVDLVNQNEANITVLEQLINAAVASGGISDLGGLLDELQGTGTDNGAAITALQTALGWPWTGGTALSRIIALETATASAPPYCEVYNASGFSLNSGQGDLYAQGGWTANKDANSMFHSQADSGFSYIQPPSAGRYRCEFWSMHDNSSDWGANFITKNTRAAANSVARDYRPAGPEGILLHATDEVDLLATDKLYWGDWTGVGCNVVGNHFGRKSIRIIVRKISAT